MVDTGYMAVENGICVVGRQFFVPSVVHTTATIEVKVRCSDSDVGKPKTCQVVTMLNPTLLTTASAMVSSARTVLLKPSSMALKLKFDLHALFEESKKTSTLSTGDRFGAILKAFDGKDFKEDTPARVSAPPVKSKILLSGGEKRTSRRKGTLTASSLAQSARIEKVVWTEASGASVSRVFAPPGTPVMYGTPLYEVEVPKNQDSGEEELHISNNSEEDEDLRSLYSCGTGYDVNQTESVDDRPDLYSQGAQVVQN
jgi:hypothetical protein